jgi:hypothetical protein
MAKAFEDRRHLASEVPEQVEEILGVDRRQFPPPEDPSTVTEEAAELQDTIDTYKIQNGLKRITVVELLGLVEKLGYRRG